VDRFIKAVLVSWLITAMDVITGQGGSTSSGNPGRLLLRLNDRRAFFNCPALSPRSWHYQTQVASSMISTDSRIHLIHPMGRPPEALMLSRMALF